MKLSKRVYVAFVSIVLAVMTLNYLYSEPVNAAVCLSHKDIVSQLQSKFKEKRQAFGLINSGHMMEVFVSKTGSWTMVVTTANKMSCVVAAGQS